MTVAVLSVPCEAPSEVAEKITVPVGVAPDPVTVAVQVTGWPGTTPVGVQLSEVELLT